MKKFVFINLIRTFAKCKIVKHLITMRNLIHIQPQPQHPQNVEWECYA
jgi:hypothetical protein